jgi:peptide/nickel transport system ATP-binding protein
MMLETRNLTFRYDSVPVLQGASLAVAPGEVIGLVGPSGTGKSTLGRILAGLLKAHSGSVCLDGNPLPASGFCPVQMLFQTVELAVNPRWKARDIIREAHDPAPDLLRDFGIREDWLERYPHELSGGELQRIAIVRALDARTRFLVADEITGMLDAITQAEIWGALLALARRRRTGMLVITHDRDLLRRVATRQLRLVDGRLVEARLDLMQPAGRPAARSAKPRHVPGGNVIALAQPR